MLISSDQGRRNGEGMGEMRIVNKSLVGKLEEAGNLGSSGPHKGIDLILRKPYGVRL
jgi:hypothetical protein